MTNQDDKWKFTVVSETSAPPAEWLTDMTGAKAFDMEIIHLYDENGEMVDCRIKDLRK
jgi:hypothetical protein